MEEDLMKKMREFDNAKETLQKKMLEDIQQ